jgi:CelD/BcsL family acetyltransferase involved in cellulose biosynthesis
MTKSSKPQINRINIHPRDNVHSITSIQEFHEGATDIRPTSAPLTVAVVNDWQELELLREEWTGVLAQNSSLTIFSTPEWLGAWWRAFGKHKQLHALVLRDDRNVLVGLVPLYIQQIPSALLPRLKEVRFVGDGSTDSDNLDFVVMPGYEEAIAKYVVQHLKSNDGWDVCRLNVMPSNSNSAQEFLVTVNSEQLKLESSTVPWSSIELPGSYEEYLQELSSKERKKIGNLSRRLESRYKVKLSRCTNLEDLPSRLEELFALHQKRWQARGKPGAFASPERRCFYYEMAGKFLKRGWLVFWTLELNGIAVAAQFGFQYNGTVYALQEGFDPDYSADSVGYLLRSFSIRKLIESGARRYHFLAGQEDSKLRWNCSNGNYINLQIARPATLGSMQLSFEQVKSACKSGVKQILPTSLVAVWDRFRTQSAT